MQVPRFRIKQSDCNNNIFILFFFIFFSYSSSSFPLGTVQIEVTDSLVVPPDRVVTATELQILGVELRQGPDVGQHRPL